MTDLQAAWEAAKKVARKHIETGDAIPWDYAIIAKDEELERVERFLADNADYDQMTEKEQEWFVENIHKKYYPENY